MIIFCERTTLDDCISIYIAEKYKVISLGGHNQATKNKHDLNDYHNNKCKYLPYHWLVCWNDSDF